MLREIQAGATRAAPPVVGPGVLAPTTATPGASASAAGEPLAGAAEAAPARPYAVDPDEKRELGDFIGYALSKTCDAIAVRGGAHWKLERREATDLGEAWAHVMLWYFPEFRLHPIFIALGASAIVFGPRVAMQLELNAKAAARKAEERGAAPPAPPAAPPAGQGGAS